MASQQTNVVEILIQAKDQASKSIGVLSDSLSTAGAAAQFAQGKITALGGALLATSVSGVKSLGLLGSAIQSIRTALDTPVGQTLIQQLSSAADEALTKTAKLSTLVKEVSGVSKDFGSGFASRSSSSTIQLFDPSVTGKQLENVVIKTADTFSKSLEQKIKNSDLATAFESKLGISIDSLAAQLDSSLSETLLSGFVGKTLPSALDTALGSVFGVNLTSKIVQSIQAAGKSNLLGGVVGKLAQGSVSGAAKEMAIGELTPSLEGAQLAGAKLSNAFGKKVAQAVLGERTPASAEFKQIDEQLGGALGDVIERLGQRFPDILEKGDLPIGKLLATKLRGLAQVTSKNELQAAGNLFVETAFSGLRNLRKNLLDDDLNAVFDLIVAPAFAAQKENFKKLVGVDADTFSKGFLDPLKKTSKNLAKGFDDGLGAGLDTIKGGGAIAEYLTNVDDFLGGGITEALSLAGNKAASSFAEGFRGAIFEEITGVLDNVDAFVLGGLERVSQIPQQLVQPVGLVSAVADPIAGATEPLELFELLEAGASKATNAVFEVSQRLTFLSFGFQALQGFVQNGPFQLLIGQNAKLQEQLLATQASLTATNKIIQNGATISDPTKAIQALGPAVEAAIAKIRKDSLELVGVTSKDLVDLFQIVAGQASNIGANLDQSANIVTSTAAALGTLGIPLFQARQEITSIVQGTIDQNSLLAKNLNLNNEMVNKWKAQGTFVEELLKKLEAFKAGNKLASQTISGITSNISELFDEIGRKAGAKFLAPIVKELDNVYQFLAANQATISTQIEGLVSTFFQAFDKIVALFKALGDPIAKIFGGVPAYLIGSLVGAVTAFSDAVIFTVNILAPAISVFSEVFKLVAPLGGVFIAASIGAKVLSAGILGVSQGFGFLAKILPGVGELLFLVDKRSNGLFNQFLNLTSILGNRGAAGFLTFAANINKIPGAAGFATKQLQGLLGGLAPLSGFIVSLAPQIGGLGIKLAGLAQAFPALKGVFEKVFVGAPGALLVLSKVVGKSEIFGSLAPLIGDASKQLAKFTGIAGNAEKANSLLTKSLQLGGAAAREFAVNSVLLGAGVGIGFIFFDQLILKNKGLQKAIQEVIGVIRKFADTVGAVLAPVLKLIGDTILPLFTFGENSNPFQKIVGGLLIAIAVAKLFGGTISNVFRTVNSSIGTLGAGISETFTKIKKANDSLREILGLAKKEGQPQLTPRQTIEAKREVSNLKQQAITSQRDSTDLSLAPETRATALKSYQDTVDRIKSLRSQIIANPIPIPFTKQFSDDITAITDKAKTVLKGFGNTVKSLVSDLREKIFQGSPQRLPLFPGLPAQVKNIETSIRGSLANINIPASLANFRRDFEKSLSGINIPASLANTRIGIDKFFRELNIPASLANSRIEINKFVSGLKSINIPDLSFGNIAGGLKAGLQNALASIKEFAVNAKNSFADFSQNANVSIGGLYSNIKKGAVGTGAFLVNSVKGIGNSFKNVIAEVGPTLLLVALFAGITTYIGFIDEQNKRVTEGTERLGKALQEVRAKIDILNTSQDKDALGALTKLTAERQRYVDAIRDPKILQDNPTLKLYDRQIEKLQKLRGLQAKPTNPEGRVRERVDKEFESFDKKFISFLGGLTGTNVKEKTVQAALAGDSLTLANQRAIASELAGELGKQAKLQEDLIRLEQRKNVLQEQGNSDGVAQAEIQIETQKDAISARITAIDVLRKEVEAVETDSQSKKDLIETLDKLKIAYNPANLKIAPIDLPRIGGAIEQATSRYQAAVTDLGKSAGDPTLFKAKINELLEAATVLQDAGILRADEVAKNFISIASNVSADRDQQIKAQQAITEAYQKEAQKRIATIDVQQAKIQAMLATGKISESEASFLTGKNEVDKIDAQFEAEKKSFEARKVIRERNAKEQQEQIERDRLIAEAQVAAATGDPTKVQALREKQAPIVKEKLATLNADLKTETAKKDSLEEINKSGLGTAETVKQFDAVSLSVSNLEKQISSITEQQGKLDGALKLSAGTQAQLDEVNQKISETKTNLASLQEEKDSADAAALKTTVGPRSRGGEEVLKQKQERKANADKALAEEQAKLKGLESQQSNLQNVIKKDPEAEASGRAAIAATLKASADASAAALAQKKEDERKFAEVEQKRNSDLAKSRAETAIKGLDLQIKATLQAEKVGETNRLAQIAQLRSKGIILESEFKRRETAERKRSIDIELQLEQQKRKEIEKLKKQGKGPSQEIENANLIKIGELVKSKADTEAQFIGDLVSELRDRLTIESQKYAVTIEQQNLKLERQKLLYNALEKGLENQNRLAESANKLGQSMIALKESEFNALNKIFDRQQAAIRKAGGEGNFADLELEEKKLILAEKLAVLKLNALKQQQKFEAESLEREIQKNDLVLKRKKDENEIAIAKKKIDIAAQDVAIKSAELEVKLRPQSEEAKLKLAQAKLGQDKNFLELGGLQQEKGFIGDEARVNDLVNNNKRRDLANTQEGQTNSALGELIAATRDPAKQEELQARLLTRLTGSSEGKSSALTTTDIEAAFNAGAQSVSVRGASFKKPTSALLGQVEQNNTFTAAPAPKPDNTPFATSFEELARKYPDKGGVGSFDELNRKYPDKAAASFDELNKKYAEAEVKPEQAIVSSFDKLSKEIDQGFANVLVAPDLKVKELTAGLEAEFERVSKKITENPVKLTIDEDRLKQVQKDLSKPLAVFDEKQLERLEGIVGALGKGETNIANSKLVGAAAGGNITINAPTTINEAQQKAGNSREEFVNVFNDILKKVGQVTAGVK